MTDDYGEYPDKETYDYFNGDYTLSPKDQRERDQRNREIQNRVRDEIRRIGANHFERKYLNRMERKYLNRIKRKYLNRMKRYLRLPRFPHLVHPAHLINHVQTISGLAAYE